MATENFAKNHKSVVAIPLNKSSKLNFGKYGFRKLLVSKNDSSDIQGEVMEVIFDEQDILKKNYKDLYEMSGFNGIVVLYNMQMTFKVGYGYKNGKIEKIIQLDPEKPGINNILNQQNNLSNVNEQITRPGPSGAKLAINNNTNKFASLDVSCYSTYIPPNDGYYVPGCDCEGYWVTTCTFHSVATPWIIDFVPDPNPSGTPSGGGSNVIPVLYGFYGALPDPCNVDPNSPVIMFYDDGRSAYLNEINQILGLNLAQQQWLLNNFEMEAVFRTYFENNGSATQENVQFIQWAVSYLLEHPNINLNEFKNQFFPITTIIADPDADNWTDPDDEILFDSDQTVYQQYQDNQPWPTIDRVIGYEKFVPIRKMSDDPTKYVNCLVLAKEQLGKVGYTCSGYLPQSQTFLIYTEQDGVDLSKTKKAISYLLSSLSQNIPVLIGVDNRAGAPTANKDNSTDHYIVVVGMGTDSKGRYFQFVDNATDNRATGASYSNRLYYNSNTGKITGQTAVVNYRNRTGMHDYIVTQVCKSIIK